MEKLTKREFITRCEEAWDSGFCNPEVILLAAEWCEAMLRLEGGQMRYFTDFLATEKERTYHFMNTLARDPLGYNVVYLTRTLAKKEK